MTDWLSLRQNHDSMTYKKFLIQQQTFDGSAYTNVGDAVDTYAKWKVVCQECPFKHLPETKELPKRDWNDENGDDVYIPSDGLKFKAYDMEVKFLYVGKESDMPSDITGFIVFICGKNANGSPLLAIYDEYTKNGRQNVIVESVDNELYFYNDISADAIAEFKVKFRVNDPVTDITLTV